MKKIFTLLIIITAFFTLTACGPNSDYYKVGSTTVFINKDDSIEINPFEIFIDNVDELVKYNMLDKAITDLDEAELKEIFELKSVEYRNIKKGSFDSYKLNVEGLIFEGNPIPTEENENQIILKANNTYDFKLHFIKKDADSEKDLLNLYVTYSFLESVREKEAVVNSALDTTYNLLNNVSSANEDGSYMTVEELKLNYEIEYTVTLNDQDVAVTNDSVNLDTAGTYNVIISLTEIGDNDGTSGASDANWDSEPVVPIEVHYTIVVK